MEQRNKPQRLPILSRIQYKGDKLSKYNLFTLKLEIQKNWDYFHLKTFKKLQNFSYVKCSPSECFPPKTAKMIASTNMLKKLTLSFSNIEGMTEIEQAFFLRLLKHIRKLEVLKVKGKENQEVDDAKVIALNKEATKIPSLKEITYKFFRCYKVSEEGIIELIRICKFFPNLETLALLVESCHNQTSEGVVKMGKGLTCLQKLKNFKFSLCALAVFITNISEEGLGLFVNNLVKLKGLERLYFHFRNCSIANNRGLINLAKMISTMPKLSHLNLFLTGFTKIDSYAFENLGLYLSQISLLIYLTLDVRNNTEINDESIAILVQQLTTLTRLKGLVLNFNYCPKFTDKGLISLKDKIPKLINLEELSLQVIAFSLFDPSIAEEGLLEISKIFGEMPKLKRLQFEFGNASTIDDDTFSTLFEEISKCKLLNKLTIRVENLSKITDNTLKNAAKTVKNMENFQALDLCFENCYNFTEEGTMAFLRKLGNNDRLQEIKLKFPGCSNLPEEAIKSVEQFTEKYL